ncbi:hypothetical protein Asulf_00035 [Archaeoglobus sulfaticallidus PM70-1]|uniref:Nucleotidyltransferase family protein n=1 Tax=Archaeoglobus sulfaticallidus PM70-1 TaxID=387631 RepID=N0BI11_9EURY|nr:hypothetical protein [Archaeoglobus sulfaticallidus]AGK60071.1 hypothetical protein Asulf_00035 [Archaeoglobus sulfaticallidus PM70-1]
MNLTGKLLKFIGSPFTQDCKENYIPDAYEFAQKNKIGLFYLEKLKECGKLSESDPLYKENIVRYMETLKTVIRISKVLNELTEEYVIFKFFKPFPHTPSDVDVLFFCSENKYRWIIEQLLNRGYYKIGEAPNQVVVYDLRGGYENIDKRTVGGKQGGKYYIDLYKEVSASYIIYLDKDKLKNYVTEIRIENEKVKVLKPEAELAVVLTHSIIPELLFTLADYYTTLYYLKNMNRKEISSFTSIFRENNILTAAQASLSIIKRLHQEFCGFVPEKIEMVVNELGENESEINNLVKNNFTMPYHYKTSTLIRVLFERMKNSTGRKSIMKQIIYMSNPRLANWVIKNIIWRKTRETY